MSPTSIGMPALLEPSAERLTSRTATNKPPASPSALPSGTVHAPTLESRLELGPGTQSDAGSSLVPPVAPNALYTLKAPPVASFVWFPPFPQTNERVSLVSTSTDLTSPIRTFAWDLADNGPFGAFEPGGPAVTTTFSTPADHVMRLRVTAANGLSGIAAETIRMSPPPAGVMQPFPIVRIAGRDFPSGVKITLLSVKAPPGARITVKCRGAHCPIKAVSRVVPAGKAISVRFRRLERFLRARVTLEILTSRNHEIGAYTRFTIRRRRLPVRVDSCLDAAGINPIACPAS
jgi:hypothetical protein